MTLKMTAAVPPSSKAIHLSRFIRPDNAPFPMVHIDVMMDTMPVNVECAIDELLTDFCGKAEAILKESCIIQ